jgi:hypothetical protein
MVDSLPPSGIDPDNETIITNSNDKLSVPLDGLTLDVGSSGKVEVFETTAYLGNFEWHSGDWTGFDEAGDGYATVNEESGASASVTADLTGIDVLTFRIDVYQIQVKIKFDGITEATLDPTGSFYKLQISGLDHYGPNTTVTIEPIGGNGTGEFRIDYVRSNPITESRKIELVDTGGL